MATMIEQTMDTQDVTKNIQLEITRVIRASRQRVFDAWTRPEYVRQWFSPGGNKTVQDAAMDLRVGGSYHLVFATRDGNQCSFRGTYLQIEPPTRSIQTWLFDGWPDAHAVESMVLCETNGVTKVTYSLAFRDQAGRDHMTKYDGLIANLDNVEDLLRSLRCKASSP